MAFLKPTLVPRDIPNYLFNNAYAAGLAYLINEKVYTFSENSLGQVVIYGATAYNLAMMANFAFGGPLERTTSYNHNEAHPTENVPQMINNLLNDTVNAAAKQPFQTDFGNDWRDGRPVNHRLI